MRRWAFALNSALPRSTSTTLLRSSSASADIIPPVHPFLWHRCAFGLYTNDNRVSAMNPPGLTPIFDGHNDVLLRLFKRKGPDAPRAFLDGEGKGQLDLPMAVQGGFAGGLFAIFVPSPKTTTAPARAEEAAP